ncbi:MAG TPA: PaaI family thioesterase [Myxococcota bacterium]|nr:PaaI family thioesterase [Myxococcota bacterium]
MEDRMLDETNVAAALAADLRRINAALARHEIADAKLAEAGALAAQLRALLEGPRRAGWYDFDPVSPMASPGARDAYADMSPIRGLRNPIAPPMYVARGTREDGSPCMRGSAVFSRAYEGPPHGVHGGYVAALFDEILGAAIGLAPPPGVTAILEVRYRNVTPIEQELRFEAWVAEDRGRRIVARATCHAGETLTADAKGTFVRVDFDEVRRRMLGEEPA